MSTAVMKKSYKRLEELRRLKRELERTHKERDIVKKALAIFSQHQL
jgi:hypothetical protein